MKNLHNVGICAQIASACAKRGASWWSFDMDVSSGPSSKRHASSTDGQDST